MANCGICYEDVSTPTCCVPCGHVFCIDCIILWQRQSSICPLCRQNIGQLQRLYLSTLPVNYISGRNSLLRIRMNDAAIVCALIVFVPFAIVYCDLGCRFLAPTVANVTSHNFDVVKNWTIGKIKPFVETAKLKQLTQDTFNCITTFIYDELSLCWSLIQIIGELYSLLIQIATLFTNGIQSALIDLYNVLKDVVVLVIPDLFYCIKSLLAYPIYKIIDVGFGFWEVLKCLWEFIKVVVAPLGWFAFNLGKVFLRLLIYSKIYRLLGQ